MIPSTLQILQTEIEAWKSSPMQMDRKITDAMVACFFDPEVTLRQIGDACQVMQTPCTLDPFLVVLLEQHYSPEQLLPHLTWMTRIARLNLDTLLFFSRLLPGHDLQILRACPQLLLQKPYVHDQYFAWILRNARRDALDSLLHYLAEYQTHRTLPYSFVSALIQNPHVAFADVIQDANGMVYQAILKHLHMFDQEILGSPDAAHIEHIYFAVLSHHEYAGLHPLIWRSLGRTIRTHAIRKGYYGLYKQYLLSTSVQGYHLFGVEDDDAILGGEWKTSEVHAILEKFLREGIPTNSGIMIGLLLRNCSWRDVRGYVLKRIGPELKGESARKALCTPLVTSHVHAFRMAINRRAIAKRLFHGYSDAPKELYRMAWQVMNWKQRLGSLFLR